jgi:methionine sulfoxide reductase heme-binding subunit
MPPRLIPALKVLAHLVCLTPFLWLLEQYRNGFLASNADPVNYITHRTGDWTLWILLGSLAITPIRRLSPKLGWLIRFRRLIGLYAFFYGTLHLATYIFLFSGYDLPGALAGVKSGHPGVIVEQWKAVWPTMRDDALKRRFIQVGLLAWLILLTLAATSPKLMLMTLGGKNWRRIHRLVYVAGIAGVVHFMWLVKAGVREPWKDAAVLAVLLLTRIAWWLRKRFAGPPSRKVESPKGRLQDVSG